MSEIERNILDRKLDTHFEAAQRWRRLIAILAVIGPASLAAVGWLLVTAANAKNDERYFRKHEATELTVTLAQHRDEIQDLKITRASFVERLEDIKRTSDRIEAKLDRK